MVGSIREILKIETSDQLQMAFVQFETDLEERLGPIEAALDRNILSPDVPDILQHMTWVEAWRSRVGRYLYLTCGFCEYSKSSRFSLPVEKGTTEVIRDQWKKTLCGPYQALQGRLENLIESIDSRVNLCKKRLGMEFEGDRLRGGGRFAA